MRRILWALLALAVAVVGAGALALRSRGVQDAIVTRIAQRRIGRGTSGLLAPGALRVLLCGTAAPRPSPRRAGACTAVFAGGGMWIVDTGPGSWRTLALRRVRGEAIGAVLYTHLHSDHIGELGEFNLQTWAAGRPGPLRVYGPDGVADLVHGFAEAYAFDTRFRVAHHGAALLPPDRAAMVPMPGVRLLVLTHFTPPPDNALLARIFRRDVHEAPPRGLVLGEDGTLVVLPTGSAAIDVTRLDP